MLLPLISSFTFSFTGWLFLWCWYQGPVAGGVGCLRVLGTYGMHPERCISVLSRWSLWVWDWFGCYRGGTGTLSSPSCCYLRAEPSDPPVASSAPRVSASSKWLEAAFGRVTFACVSPARWNLIWKAFIKWIYEKKRIPWQAGSTVEADNPLPRCWTTTTTPQDWMQLTSHLSLPWSFGGQSPVKD